MTNYIFYFNNYLHILENPRRFDYTLTLIHNDYILFCTDQWSEIKNIVENKLAEIENLNKKILVGMSANEVKNAIGLPNIKDNIEKGDRSYQLWTYNNNTKVTKIYFEENLVIKVE